MPGSEGWDLGRPIPRASLRGATAGKLPSWESEQLMGRAGFERPKWGPKPKGLGCSRRQSPCSLFRTRTVGRRINGSGGRCADEETEASERGGEA